MADIPLHILGSMVVGNNDTKNSPSKKHNKENARRLSLRSPFVPVQPQRMKSFNTLRPEITGLSQNEKCDLDTSILTCPICLDPYSNTLKNKKPRVLPYCGHTLCDSCLRKTLGFHKSPFLCHICKRPNPLTSHKSAEDFPLSWAIIDVLEQLHKSRRETKEEKKIEKCPICKRNEVSHYCREHGSKFCAYCGMNHTKECKKVMELCEIPSFAKQTVRNGKEFLEKVKERIEEARKEKLKVMVEINEKFDGIIQCINQARSETIYKLEGHVAQLELLAGEIEYTLKASEAFSELNSIYPNKNFTKSLTKLEEVTAKYCPEFDNSFKLHYTFNSEPYDTCSKNLKGWFDISIESPYTKCSKAELYNIFFSACERGDTKAVDYLIKSAGLDVNQSKDQNGNTPFMLAVLGGRHETCKLLHEKYGANVNIPDNAGKTPLIFTCLSNNVEITGYLVKKAKADPDLQNKWKDTALHCAVEARNITLVKMLVEEAKANLALRNGKGKTASELATDVEIRNYLTKCEKFKEGLIN